MSDYSWVESDVRMLIECKTPLMSTPDVFDIYHNSVTNIPTDFSTTTELPDEMTTIQSSQCQFDKNEHGAIFDTGNPYQNNMRDGLLMSKLSINFSKNA